VELPSLIRVFWFWEIIPPIAARGKRFAVFFVDIDRNIYKKWKIKGANHGDFGKRCAEKPRRRAADPRQGAQKAVYWIPKIQRKSGISCRKTSSNYSSKK
jgi:hypothetical protein